VLPHTCTGGDEGKSTSGFVAECGAVLGETRSCEFDEHETKAILRRLTIAATRWVFRCGRLN
jgi:hypothetical protein